MMNIEMQTEFRNLSNHWSMFGPSALVQKVASRWHLSALCGNHPGTFKTKREAMAAVDALVLERSRRVREQAAA